MRRDMDIVRQIAFAVESAEDGLSSEDMHLPGFTEDQIAYHCELMNESGLVNVIDTSTMGRKISTFHINRLTSKGHDFVDAARSDTIWNKAKTAIASSVGGVAIDVMIRYLKHQALKALGLPSES